MPDPDPNPHYRLAPVDRNPQEDFTIPGYDESFNEPHEEFVDYSAARSWTPDINDEDDCLYVTEKQMAYEEARVASEANVSFNH